MFISRSRYYRSLTAIVLLILSLCINHQTFAQDSTQDTPSITIPYIASHTPEHPDYYYEQALKLALTKTESAHGKLDVRFYSFSTTSERQRAILTTNSGLDLIWGSSSVLREDKMLAIKFNLLRELSDYRLLLIRKDDREKFAAVKNIDDLKKFKAGIVADWQDKKKFQLNNIPFVASWAYEPMFKMLAEKRFDYIMRSAQEIWPELEQRQDLPIMAEEKLLIAYQSPVYFFVHTSNEKLATRIKKGLQIAEKDGSLKVLFMSLPAFKKGYQEIKNKQRTLINMNDEDAVVLDL
ncbi:MAG: transporter substrate-binding domain-containing protein [Gammaproteobacteria bacterium]|nr:MAG: transporter substrate-binding domain-containing protein [Gammaproteobacteria bacterium]